MAALNQNVHDHNLKTDELVGSLFFKAIVTLSLTQADISHGLLKSNTSRFIESYDYRAAEQHLQTIGADQVPGIDAEPRKAVFQLLGFICRSFSTSSSYRVMRELLKFGRERTIVDTATSTNRVLSGTFTQFRDDHEIPGYESQADEILSRYTSILYEEGSRRGVFISRSTSFLSLEPPRIRATVYFGALEAIGIGRSKKVAWHLAAKKICDKLNFTV